MKNLPKDKDAGIRKLPSSVQENMGYDPLSQQRSMTAGGSRPMHQASTVQIDPMTGLPLQANAPNMGNFGGAMGMSNVPMYDQSMSPGAIAQSRKAKKLGQDFYKQTFTDQVFSDTPNENVTKGSYNMVKGPSLKGVDGKPVYGKQQIYNSLGPNSFSIDKTSKDNYSIGMGKPKEDLNQERKYSKEILTRPMTSEQLENYESAVTSYKDSTNAWVNNQGPEPKIPDYTSFKLTPAEKAGEAAGKFGLKAIGKPKS